MVVAFRGHFFKGMKYSLPIVVVDVISNSFIEL